MVLEQTTRRRCHLGSLRVVQSWRKRYSKGVYLSCWVHGLTGLDSGFARDAFAALIPISVDSDARANIIRDYFDLMAAIAAHGKSNGLGGRKLSRFAGWWAFEHYDTGKGFDSGYKSWAK
jgi:hypothetical protein